MPDLVLTQKGRDAVNDPTLKGPGLVLLDYLDKNGPSDIENISRFLRISNAQGRRMANLLGARGFITLDRGD